MKQKRKKKTTKTGMRRGNTNPRFWNAQNNSKESLKRKFTTDIIFGSKQSRKKIWSPNSKYSVHEEIHSNPVGLNSSYKKRVNGPQEKYYNCSYVKQFHKENGQYEDNGDSYCKDSSPGSQNRENWMRSQGDTEFDLEKQIGNGMSLNSPGVGSRGKQKILRYINNASMNRKR